MKGHDWERVQQLTVQHMEHPEVGDRFTEMYSYWVHVVALLGPAVVVQEFAGQEPTIVAYDSAAEFRKHYAYGSIPGYSVHYVDTLAPDEIAAFLDRAPAKKTSVRGAPPAGPP